MSRKVKLIFIYFKNNYPIIKDEEDNIINELKNYSSTLNRKFEELIFVYQGKKLKVNNNLKLKHFQKRIIKLLVIDPKLKNEIISHPKQLLCPKCKNLTLFKIKDDKISTSNCIKRDNFQNLEINKFLQSQNFNEENIICEECNNSKTYYKNDFYKCSCNKNICILCKNKHQNDKQIDFYNYFFKCNKHNILYSIYCEECQQNICMKCEEKHKKHNRIYYKRIMQSEKKINIIKNEINEGMEKMLKYGKNLEKLKKILNQKIDYLKNDISEYYQLLEKIFYCVNNLYNYENIQTLINYESFKIGKYINRNIKEKIKKCLKTQIDLFDKENKMEMIYESKNDSKIFLFGEEFAKNNKKNCILVINDEIKEFNYYYSIDIKKETSIRVELFEENKITNFASLFANCKLLKYLDLSYWDMKHITNIHQMFRTCQLLSSIKCQNNWNTENITDLSDVFFECYYLKYLPDISKWNTKNIKNMKNLFKGCNALISIPDISNWDTKNVTNLSNMFSGCKSLASLPDISRWDISNVTDLNGMFNECNALKNLPDISNWNTSNVSNMKYMFNKCISLEYLPDISKWDTSNVTSFYQIFNDCYKLKNLPKIEENWNISSKCDISCMFNGCTGLGNNYIEYNKKMELLKKNPKKLNKINLWDTN